MNFYDKIHELVRSFKETEEYRDYVAIKKAVQGDQELYEKLKKFKDEQRNSQMEYINTGKMSEIKQKELLNMYEELMKYEKIKKMFECEIKIDVLLADMQKIIAEGIKEIIEF